MALLQLHNDEEDKFFFDRNNQGKPARQISVKLERYALYKSITYIISLGISGLCISAFGSEMNTLAANISSSPQVLSGWLFFLRGLGCTMGSLGSSMIYSHVNNGDRALAGGLFIETMTVLLVFGSTTLPLLEMGFFMNGLLGGLNDAGAAILIRKTHGKEAGPWMSLLGIGFALFASLYPIIAMLFSYPPYRVCVVAGLIVALGGAILFGVHYTALDPEDTEHLRAIDAELRSNQSSQKTIDKTIPHYRVELGLAFVTFVLVGCQLNLAANFVVYTESTGVISATSLKALLFFYWLLLAIGRILGVWDQRGIVHDSAIVTRLVCCASISALSFVPIILFPHSATALWVGICVFSFSYAPGTGYCFDLNNRLTLPTALSTSIVLTGINAGGCLMPYMTHTLWTLMGNQLRPELLMILCFTTLAMTVPVVFFTRSWSYSKTLPGFVLSRESTYYDYDTVSKHRFRVAATAVRAMMKMVNLRRKSHTDDDDGDDDALKGERQALLLKSEGASSAEYGSHA